MPSIVQRFRRFLMNPHFRFHQWYAPMTRNLLAQAANYTPLRLIIDSKVGTKHQPLMVALAYRKRALPIAWTWILQARGTAVQDSCLGGQRSRACASQDVGILGKGVLRST